MNSTPGGGEWGLEIVRGRDVGKVLPLGGGEVTLGNDLGGEPGLNLADQEGTAPRKMAGKQARIEAKAGGLVLRDLDSPGGTFVNRQRVLSGQARTLKVGDTIQLGGVQLKVVNGSAAPVATEPRAAPVRPAPVAPRATRPSPSSGEPRVAPAAPPPRPQPVAPTATAPVPGGGSLFAFTLRTGSVCRSWDDFLTVSAQRWADLREELTSGRLAEFARSIGRPSLAPAATASGSDDERLDAWLASLPTTREARPELEVHPAQLAVKVGAEGGMVRRKLQVTNLGYRLLRANARVEPADCPWLALARAFEGREFLAIEATDLPIEIRFPAVVTGPLSAAILVESNGGTQRVPVKLEPPSARTEVPEPSGVAAAGSEWGLRDAIAHVPVFARFLALGAAGLVGRVLLTVGDRLVPGAVGTPPPGLRGAAVLFAVLGAVAGGLLALRKGTAGDVPSAGFAGAFGGVLAAALLVAACRSVEPMFGLTSPWLAAGLWAAVGLVVAAASAALIPARARQPEVSP